MKKLVFIAVFTVTGLMVVSCDKESLVEATPQVNKLQKAKVENSFARQVDSIAVQTTTTPGPGDDVVIITPPKP